MSPFNCFAFSRESKAEDHAKILYSRLQITRTLAVNFEPKRFPFDFLDTFTVISPSVTRTLHNSNLQLTRSNFCFLSDHFSKILPSITRTVFQAHDQSKKKNCTVVRNIEFVSKQPRVFHLLFSRKYMYR